MTHKHSLVEDVIINNYSETPIIDAMTKLSNNTKEPGNITKLEDKVIRIRNLHEYEKFKKKYDRSVIFYGAKWCHACTEISNLYNRIAKRYYKRVAMAYVDIDEANLDFTAVPVFVGLRYGKQIDSIEGGEKHELKELIKKTITCA